MLTIYGPDFKPMTRFATDTSDLSDVAVRRYASPAPAYLVCERSGVRVVWIVKHLTYCICNVPQLLPVVHLASQRSLTMDATGYRQRIQPRTVNSPCSMLMRDNGAARRLAMSMSEMRMSFAQRLPGAKHVGSRAQAGLHCRGAVVAGRLLHRRLGRTPAGRRVPVHAGGRVPGAVQLSRRFARRPDGRVGAVRPAPGHRQLRPGKSTDCYVAPPTAPVSTDGTSLTWSQGVSYIGTAQSMFHHAQNGSRKAHSFTLCAFVASTGVEGVESRDMAAHRAAGASVDS